MLILVCGGRHYANGAAIRAALLEYRQAGVTVLHGGARGADALAGAAARELGMEVVVEAADWATYGRAAGPVRNRAMLEREPDLVLAFDGGKGTADMCRRARAAGVPVREVAATPQA